MSNLDLAKQALQSQKWKEEQEELKKEAEKEKQELALDIQANGIEYVINNGKYNLWQIVQYQMRDLGNQIKIERKAKGWKQKHLARQANCSATTIGRLEKYGWGSPITIMKAAAALGKQLTIK